ncbi:unnamed protein product, partial [Tetraodon nigroviridis]
FHATPRAPRRPPSARRQLPCSPAGNCGPSRATGHLRVLLHPRRAHGGAAVRPGDQPQLGGRRWERVPGCRLQPDGDRHRERRRPGWRDVPSPAFPPPPPPPPPPLSVLAAVILILLLFFLLLSIFTYVFLSALGLLIIIGLHQLLESRKRRRPAPKVETGTSSHDGVDLSWIPQETLNQIS